LVSKIQKSDEPPNKKCFIGALSQHQKGWDRNDLHSVFAAALFILIYRVIPRLKYERLSITAKG
jgi:hypothetical protein